MESGLTVDVLRQYVTYDPDTGIFVRIKRPDNPGGRSYVGEVLGSPDSYGYLSFFICGRKYLAHRLAWLYIHGEWPSDEIDHINCIRSDNRLLNLRISTRSQNMANSRSNRKNNKSGFKGVHFHKPLGKWCAAIRHDKRRRHLGYFDSIAEAHSAYSAAAYKLHGQFARVA